MAGFFGLDALALWLAFRWHFRQTRQETRIQITAKDVKLHHSQADRPKKYAEFPTAFARVEYDQPPTPSSLLRIEYQNTAYIIGRFLTVEERTSLARALRSALIKAKNERNYSVL